MNDMKNPSERVGEVYLDSTEAHRRAKPAGQKDTHLTWEIIDGKGMAMRTD
jgi:hypothetical protein